MIRTQPDIILMVLDTQRADRLSCYGHSRETTPHLDALAADATHFRYAFSTAQWTMPAHASMFTGLYPSAHTTMQTNAVLPASIPTLAERLRAAGYYTVAFCNNPLVGVVNNGLRRGFYSFLNYSGLLTSRPNQAGQRPSPIDRYRQVFKRILSALVTRIQDSFARSEFLFALSRTPLMVPLWQTALSFKGNTVKSLNDAARLLTTRREAGDRPIFAFINLMGTHTPYHPPRRLLDRYAPDFQRDKAAQRYLRSFNSDIYGWLAPLHDPISPSQKATLDAVYDAETANQDEQVGAFIARLRASGALDHSLLMVTADHGDHLGEKELIGHCFAAYNELVRVPLIIRDPTGDLPRGVTSDQVVSTRRLFQTALTTAGVASETERELTLARDPGADPDGGTVFAEAAPLQNVVNMVLRRQPQLVYERGYDEVCRAVLSGEHKLLQLGQQRVELYSVADDPHESLNLRDMLPEKVEQLQERLATFVATNRTSVTVVERPPEDDPTVRRRLRDLGYLE